MAHLLEQPDAPDDRQSFADLQGVIVWSLLGGVAPVVAGLLAVFTVYCGVALGVTLFHSDPAVRRHAAGVLRDLLRVIFGRRLG
jgi:hypothetical protein